MLSQLSQDRLQAKRIRRLLSEKTRAISDMVVMLEASCIDLEDLETRIEAQEVARETSVPCPSR